MVRAKIRKVMYWHKIAQVLLEHGLMPSEIGSIMRSIYPQAEINGRHIGAYKRRLIDDGIWNYDKPHHLLGIIEKGLPKIITPNEGMRMAEGLIGADDEFIYSCVVGSHKRTLKCFEYKMTQEIVDHEDEIEAWLGKINGD